MRTLWDRIKRNRYRHRLTEREIIGYVSFGFFGLVGGIASANLNNLTINPSTLAIAIATVFATRMAYLSIEENEKHKKIERVYEVFEKMKANDPNFLTELKKHTNQYINELKKIRLNGETYKGDIVRKVYEQFGNALKNRRIEITIKGYPHTVFQQTEIIMKRYHRNDFDKECFDEMLGDHIKEISGYILPFMYAAMILKNMDDEDREKGENYAIDRSVEKCIEEQNPPHKNLMRYLIEKSYGLDREEEVLFRMFRIKTEQPLVEIQPH